MTVSCLDPSLDMEELNFQIVATALPQISEELGASPSEYSWVGTVSSFGPSTWSEADKSHTP